MVPPEQREAGQQPAGFLGGEGPPLGLPRGPARGRPGAWAAAPCGPGWLSMAPSSSANWRMRRARIERQAIRLSWPSLPASWALPAADVGRADRARWGGHRTRAARGSRSRLSVAARVVGLRSGSVDPDCPPLVRPAAEREPAAAASLPGAAAHLQPLLGGQVAGLVGGVDRLGALGAVVQPPGDLVAVAALAPAHRAHQGLPAPSWADRRSAGPGRRRRIGQAAGGRWRRGRDS